jgi:sulfur relay (sulfurtransferase) complex TusBCD TusD component (DsrE family)
MKLIKSVVVALCAMFSLAANAGPNDPLFVSLTTDDVHRARMALNFGKHHSENGHPLSVFLSDKGVYIGVKSGSTQYAEHQKIIADVIAKGGSVIMCPMCLRHYGFSEADLIPGIKMGNPKTTGDALFKDGTKTLSW